MNQIQEPIQHKITRAILITSTIVLLLTGLTYLVFEFITFRESTVERMSVLGEVIANNSTAALAFESPEEAYEILSALRAQEYIVAAALFDEHGGLFSKFPATLDSTFLPTEPNKTGYFFRDRYLHGYQPVVLGEKRIGTLYLNYDTRILSRQFRFFGLVALSVFIFSLMLAYVLSSQLQKKISRPIVALADVASSISRRKDYSVRGVKQSEDEIGLLTDAFNQMLAQIEQQNLALQESEKRFRTLADNIAQLAWITDKTGYITWFNKRWFDYTGTTPAAMDKYGWRNVHHPDHKERVVEGYKRAMREGYIWEDTFPLRSSDGNYRWFLTRAVPIHDEQGSIIHWFGTNTDITELLEAEKRLQEASDNLTLATEASRLGWGTWDFRTGEAQWDERARQILGLSQTAATTSDGWLSYVHPEDREFIRQHVEDCIASRQSFDMEYRITNEHGEIRFIHATGAFEVAPDGTPIKGTGLVRDITEQKQAEEALRKSEEYYKTMTDNTPVMTWISQPDALCTYLNKQWYEYTGQTPETGLGFGWLGAIHPDDAGMTEKVLLKATDEQAPFSLEFRLKDREGNYRWHIDTGFPKFDEQGVFEGFIGSVIDIHERKIAEERLRESEEFSRTLLESSPDCVAALDLTGMLLSINPQGLIMLEIDSFEKYYKQSWFDVWMDEHQQEAYKALDNARNGKIGHFQGVAQTFKGASKWLDVLIAPVHGAGGEVERLVAVSRDISKLKELEQQKDDFIGIASHELKTPVTSIKAYTQVLHNRFEQSEDQLSADMLMKMDTQLDKLTKLITDLLDVTKIEQGRLQFRMEEFDFNELINDVVEDIQRTADRHQVVQKLVKNPKVVGDRDRIGQVITNFLTNAIKYSPKANKVVVSTSINSRNELVVSVQDFGLGLSEEEKVKVFERFYRVGDPGYETYPGLGLGLFISTGIVHRHNGRIWVESEKGVGSTFSFSLPLG